jgi:hypothetical protein
MGSRFGVEVSSVVAKPDSHIKNLKGEIVIFPMKIECQPQDFENEILAYSSR